MPTSMAQVVVSIMFMYYISVSCFCVFQVKNRIKVLAHSFWAANSKKHDIRTILYHQRFFCIPFVH